MESDIDLSVKVSFSDTDSDSDISQGDGDRHYVNTTAEILTQMTKPGQL